MMNIMMIFVTAMFVNLLKLIMNFVYYNNMYYYYYYSYYFYYYLKYLSFLIILHYLNYTLDR
jgi:hypothetical protein